jgi:hypothetical protein
MTESAQIERTDDQLNRLMLALSSPDSFSAASPIVDLLS